VKQNDYIILGIWVAVIAATFLFLWQRGYLARLTAYVAETREELKKCTWPSWDELKGSTVVVMISIFILGIYTVAVDQVLYQFVKFVVMQ
jgi:preprotein translocase subunit SecE